MQHQATRRRSSAAATSRAALLAALFVSSLAFLSSCTTNRGPAPDGQPPQQSWIRHAGPVKSVVVRKIESEVATGSGLAAVVAYPESANAARFPEGAPVCVVVQDGFGAGIIPAGYTGFAPDGVVTIAFALPGGTAGNGERSGGSFDYRGDNCSVALRDVIRFAEGLGRGQAAGSDTASTLQGMIPYPVLSNEITVLAYGNGGNLAVPTLGRYGDILHGVSNYIAWEVPAGDQFVGHDFGNANDTSVSHYVDGSCLPESCAVDYSKLAIDLDHYDFVQDPRPNAGSAFVPVQGIIYFDDNANGVADTVNAPKEQVVHPMIGGTGPKAYFSIEMTRAIQLREYRTGFVQDTLSAAEYWAIRDETVGVPNYFTKTVTMIDSLRVMVLGSEVDHSQRTPDHAQIVLEYNEWLKAQAQWVRLNPDASYRADAGAPGGAETPANAPVDFADVTSKLLPEEAQPGEPDAIRAAVMEMADRRHFEKWETDLSGVLVITAP